MHLSLVLRTPEARAHAPTRRTGRSDRCRWIAQEPPIYMTVTLQRRRGPTADLTRHCVVVSLAHWNARLEHGDVWKDGRRWRSEIGTVRNTRPEAIADVLASHNLNLPEHTRWEALVAWAERGKIPQFVTPPLFVGWCSMAVYDNREGCVWCERITPLRGRSVTWRR